MGRHVTGDRDFQYKLAFGDQAAELVHLASLSGAGEVSLFWKLDVTDGPELDFLEECTDLAAFDDPTELFERRAREVADTLANRRVELDAQLERPLYAVDLQSKIALTAAATFVVRRADWPVLLGWINARLPPRRALDLDDLRQDCPARSRADRWIDPSHFLRGLLDLAFAILCFAVENDLEEFGVGDQDAILLATVHDPARPAAEVVVQDDDGADFERARFAAYAARADGVVVTPQPRTHGRARAVEAAKASLADAAESEFVSVARRALRDGDAARALPYLVAALQYAHPSWPGGREVRRLAREARAELDRASPDMSAVYGLYELLDENTTDTLLSTLHRLSVDLGLDHDVAGALSADAIARAGAKRRGRALARALVDDPAASDAGRATAAFALAQLARRRKATAWQVRWLKRAVAGALPPRIRYEALCALGQLHRESAKVPTERRELKRALRLFEAAIAAWPAGTAARFRRAFVLDLLGRPKAAINEYTRVLALGPTITGARYNRACGYALIGKRELALRDLARAIAAKPKYRNDARTERYFDSIRSDRRFVRLVGR